MSRPVETHAARPPALPDPSERVPVAPEALAAALRANAVDGAGLALTERADGPTPVDDLDEITSGIEEARRRSNALARSADAAGLQHEHGKRARSVDGLPFGCVNSLATSPCHAATSPGDSVATATPSSAAPASPSFASAESPVDATPTPLSTAAAADTAAAVALHPLCSVLFGSPLSVAGLQLFNDAVHAPLRDALCVALLARMQRTHSSAEVINRLVRAIAHDAQRQPPQRATLLSFVADRLRVAIWRNATISANGLIVIAIAADEPATSVAYSAEAPATSVANVARRVRDYVRLSDAKSSNSNGPRLKGFDSIYLPLTELDSEARDAIVELVRTPSHGFVDAFVRLGCFTPINGSRGSGSFKSGSKQALAAAAALRDIGAAGTATLPFVSLPAPVHGPLVPSVPSVAADVFGSSASLADQYDMSSAYASTGGLPPASLADQHHMSSAYASTGVLPSASLADHVLSPPAYAPARHALLARSGQPDSSITPAPSIAAVVVTQAFAVTGAPARLDSTSVHAPPPSSDDDA